MNSAILVSRELDAVSQLRQDLDIPGRVELLCYRQMDDSANLDVVFWTCEEVESLEDAVHKQVLHHPEQAAVCWRRRKGTRLSEEWWLDGKVHREGGAAVLLFGPDEKVMNATHFHLGNKVSGPTAGMASSI